MSASDPAAVDMGRVAATERIVDALCAGRLDLHAAARALAAVGHQPAVSTWRFAVMAAAGAAALAVIFGAPTNGLSLPLIALSAGLGAWLRKEIGHHSANPFIQPLFAALLAGGIGSLSASFHLAVAQRLVVVCPCMVLVPGPHLLNATIDLGRGRIPLGSARMMFAALIVMAICVGLLLGLWPSGAGLPHGAPGAGVSIIYDLGAAGVAVAAYGSFFNMPWRMLPLPIAIGMLAHAARWELLQGGANAIAAAFVASLIAGALAAPIADRLRIPFAALGFATVVSLMPGVYLFEVASGLVGAVRDGQMTAAAFSREILSDGTTALLLILAITFGLIVPRVCFEELVAFLHRPKAPA